MATAETIDVDARVINDTPEAADPQREDDDALAGALTVGLLIGMVRELLVLSVVLAFFSGWVAFAVYLILSFVTLFATKPLVEAGIEKIPHKAYVAVGHPIVGASRFVAGLFGRKAK